MVKKNACIFISGMGSNLRNLILRSRDYSFPIKIKLIVLIIKKNAFRDSLCKKKFNPTLNN